MLPVNGIELCAETFGEPTDPALLLIAGATSPMDWWEDEFCRRLAAGGRFVIRYDHRDTGRSTAFPAGDPPYSGVDLAHDALGVLDGFGAHRAHLVGAGLGGVLAMRIGAERPHRLLSLTLMSTGTDLPAPAVSACVRAEMPAGVPAEVPAEVPAPHDWSDRRASVRRMVAAARALGGPFTADEPHLRRLAERAFDRTHDMAAAQLNHRCLPGGPPVRPAAITAPTVVLHGTLDPVHPPAGAQVLAGEIPGARLVWMEGVGHESPPAAVWNQVIGHIIGQPARGRQPA
jgi:pimeloyl-ACP methyl ester carboxylesterase